MTSTDPPSLRPGSPAARRTFVVASAVVLLLLAMLVIGVATILRGGGSLVATDPHAPPQPLPLPEPPPSGYVGSAACAECHAEIASRYAEHPMGQSLARIGDERPIEDYAHPSFSPDQRRQYLVERRGDEVFHHERLADPHGEWIYDQAEQVNYVLGSGQLGRSYLLERHGTLYQSPIGWYTSGARWDLSPGYDRATNPRFQRRVGDGCLYCHAGRVLSEAPRSDRYEPPVFAELSIGCERCHGPGEEHVRRQRASGGEPGRDPSIVNPAHLDFDRREAVCYQCHLQGESVIPRFGRSMFDFRPGQRLEDSLIVLVGKTRVDAQGHARAVSQVEQMRSSTCYLQSSQRMGCTSCHDPHGVPREEERVTFYRQACLKCHQEDACALEPAERQQPPADDSCVHCHMPSKQSSDVPHTAQTDHRILRRPDLAEAPEDELRVPIQEAVVFDGAEQRLPRREVERARALAMDDKLTSDDADTAREIERLLLGGGMLSDDVGAGLQLLGNDPPALNALGTACRMQKRYQEAEICWQEALRYNPKDEQALLLMLLHHHSLQDTRSALEYVERLLELLPDAPTLHGRRAHMLGQLGQTDQAIKAAERALELDPTLIQIHIWLIEVYTGRGELDRADEVRKLLERFRLSGGE
ncbi:MAG: tetratricopeptide repeat protein [Pirellulaceae bacterium]|nr:tetratricopeptide repeat protein [Pirellulaceae bacterium]